MTGHLKNVPERTSRERAIHIVKLHTQLANHVDEAVTVNEAKPAFGGTVINGFANKMTGPLILQVSLKSVC